MNPVTIQNPAACGSSPFVISKSVLLQEGILMSVDNEQSTLQIQPSLWLMTRNTLTLVEENLKTKSVQLYITVRNTDRIRHGCSWALQQYHHLQSFFLFFLNICIELQIKDLWASGCSLSLLFSKLPKWLVLARYFKKQTTLREQKKLWSITIYSI